MPERRHKYLDPEMISKLKSLDFVSRLVTTGTVSGVHKSLRKGYNIEFSEYKSYVPGMDIRHIDWKVYGKRDRFYIKQFDEDTSVKAYLVLDKSNSMGYKSGRLTKLEYAAYLATSIAYLLIAQQDAVGLVACDDKILKHIPPRSSPAHLEEMLTYLDGVVPSSTTDLSKTLNDLALAVKTRSLFIIMSDLFDEQENVIKALKRLLCRHHEVIIFHVIDRNEIDFNFKDALLFEDMETSEKMQTHPALLRRSYKKAIDQFIGFYRNKLYETNIDYILSVTSDPYEVTLGNYLEKRLRL